MMLYGLVFRVLGLREERGDETDLR